MKNKLLRIMELAFLINPGPIEECKPYLVIRYSGNTGMLAVDAYSRRRQLPDKHWGIYADTDKLGDDPEDCIAYLERLLNHATINRS